MDRLSQARTCMKIKAWGLGHFFCQTSDSSMIATIHIGLDGTLGTKEDINGTKIMTDRRHILPSDWLAEDKSFTGRPIKTVLEILA